MSVPLTPARGQIAPAPELRSFAFITASACVIVVIVIVIIVIIIAITVPTRQTLCTTAQACCDHGSKPELSVCPDLDAEVP